MCKHHKHHIEMAAWCCHYWQKLVLGGKEEVCSRLTLPPIAQPIQAVWNLVPRHIIVNFKKKQVVGSPAHLLQSSSDSHISIKTTTTGCWIIGSLAHLLQSHGHSHISIKHRLLDHWVTGTSATVSWSFSHFNKKQQQVVGSLGHWHICYSLMVILTFQ